MGALGSFIDQIRANVINVVPKKILSKLSIESRFIQSDMICAQSDIAN